MRRGLFVLLALLLGWAAEGRAEVSSVGRQPGSPVEKTVVLKTGSLTTTAITANQVVLTYTVTSGKTLYLETLVVQTRLSAVSATASVLGAWSLETPSGTKVVTATAVNPTTSNIMQIVLPFNDLPISSGTVIRVVCTPAATTSMLWIANFGGFER